MGRKIFHTFSIPFDEDKQKEIHLFWDWSLIESFIPITLDEYIENRYEFKKETYDFTLKRSSSDVWLNILIMIFNTRNEKHNNDPVAISNHINVTIYIKTISFWLTSTLYSLFDSSNQIAVLRWPQGKISLSWVFFLLIDIFFFIKYRGRRVPSSCADKT